MPILFIYIVLLVLLMGSFYLSLTSTHIYLYFILLLSTVYFLKKYVYVLYSLYLNFYWAFFLYNLFYIYSIILLYNACAVYLGFLQIYF